MNSIQPAQPLYGQAENSLSLSASLEKANASGLLEGAVGLFYSPKRCSVGRVSANGKIKTLIKNRQTKSNRTKNKQAWKVIESLNLDDVFEAKLFTESAELNWLNDPHDVGGRAVLVTTKAIKTTIFAQSLQMDDICGVLPQSYLVWGQYDAATEGIPEGWAIVSTSQIGQLAVPIEAGSDSGFVLLNTQEYLASDDYGNAYVKYERLLNLSWETKEGK